MFEVEYYFTYVVLLKIQYYLTVRDTVRNTELFDSTRYC